MMIYNGIRSWPPVWVWKGGNANTNPKGEVGIVLDVALDRGPPTPVVF